MRLVGRGFEVGDALPPELVAQAQARFRDEWRRRQAEMRGTDDLQARIDAGALSLDEALQDVAASDRLLDAATLLAHALQLERTFVFQMLATGDVNTTALAFKALGLAYGTLAAVLAVRARKRHEAVERHAVSAQDYLAMDPAAARRTMRFLKVRLTVKS